MPVCSTGLGKLAAGCGGSFSAFAFDPPQP